MDNEIIKDLIGIIQLAYFKMFDYKIVTSNEYKIVTKEMNELRTRLDRSEVEEIGIKLLKLFTMKVEVAHVQAVKRKYGKKEPSLYWMEMVGYKLDRIRQKDGLWYKYILLKHCNN